MVFVETDSFRNLRRLPTDAFRSIPRLPREVLPVAASDLVAWYPFRSGTGEDITAGDNNFGDTTDYSATVNGATYKPNGGVTDIQTGANSGAFDFDGTDDSIDLGTVADSDQSLTFMTWVNFDVVNDNEFTRILTKTDGYDITENGSFILHLRDGSNKPAIIVRANNQLELIGSTAVTANTYNHFAVRYDFSRGDVTLFKNGQPINNGSVGQIPPSTSQQWRVGADDPPGAVEEFMNATADGSRIYTAALSDSQINQIYLNTKP